MRVCARERESERDFGIEIKNDTSKHKNCNIIVFFLQ